jgi:hypothetical protein
MADTHTSVPEKDRDLDKNANESLEAASDGAAGGAAATTAEYRKLVHRVDRRLIVTLGFMYCISVLDRTNIGAANIAGMSADLGLEVGYRYVSDLPTDPRKDDIASWCRFSRLRERSQNCTDIGIKHLSR